MVRKAIIGCLFFLLSHVSQAQVTFVIESLPSATPGTDTIFITGSFNEWNPHDIRYALKQQLNGQLTVTIPLSTADIEYKFTRGSWTKVETSAQNNNVSNRIFKHGSPHKVYVRIYNWLDLGGVSQIDYFIFYCFASALLAMALTLLAYRIPKKDIVKFNAFEVVNVTLAALLVLLILCERANQVWRSYFTFLFHISFFCWSPLLLYFMHRFYFKKDPRHLYLYFLPATLAVLFVIVRIYNPVNFNLSSENMWTSITRVNLFVLGAGFIFNTVLHIGMYRQFVFLKLKLSAGENIVTHFLYFLFWISFISLTIVPLNTLLLGLGVHSVLVNDFHAVAIALSFLLVMEAYFLWRHPEILKEDKAATVHTEDSKHWMERVAALMKEKKPYRNPDLSVSDLADMLETKPHVLSKIINDSYHKNFRDFVNTYRIEEFIRLAHTKEFKHYTFLALAQEVGFNSKSTFNLAFKKLTHQSPREYFKRKEPDIKHAKYSDH